VADGSIAVDAEDPASVAAGLAELSDVQRRASIQSAIAAVGARHPRPLDTARSLVDLLAGLAHRPDAGVRDGVPLSVVSTVKNEGVHAEDLVRRLLAQADAEDDVVIVDGGSDDDTLPLLQQLARTDARLKVIEAPGCGISEGRNIGIRAATTDWIACTDAGCVPEDGWLMSLKAAGASGAGDLITGTYRASYGQGHAWEIALAHVAYPNPEELRRRTPLVKAYSAAFGRAYDATLPTGRSVAFTTEVWRAAGGFPEDLPTAEDVMFGQNAVEHGARAVLCADACVTWDQRPTLRSNAKMFYGYGHGDGLSGDRRLIGRDLLRAAVYAVGPAMLLSGRTRPLALAGAAAYLSLPAVRATRGPRPLAATLMVPAMAAMRDLAKAAGCLTGLRDRRRVGA
jgi:GT2 family glycosyltransferase